jgi:ATP-dependent exoDNAse (exonuclease V) beta subunit
VADAAPGLFDAPPDQAARDRIRTDLDSTLFVEAGAGSGKTTALVDRVLALVTTGTAEIAEIAAITFTEKAATELRDRIRQRLEETATAAGGTVDGAVDEEVAERCATALDQLDSAAIGTLHAFAQRLLLEHPIEAGIPPRIEVLDEVESGVAFDERWSRFLDRMLDDPAVERTILLFLDSGPRLDAITALAEAFEASWDLVRDRVPADEPDPPDVHALVRPVLRDADAVVALGDHCTDDGDRLLARLGEIDEAIAALRTAPDEYALVRLLSDDSLKPFRHGGYGRAPAWNGRKADVCGRIDAVRARLEQARQAVTGACAHRLASEIRRFTLDAAAERRADGHLAFHDLLVLARSLLRDEVHGARVRERLHARYRYLLLDEFQDTDPLQIELAALIAAEPGAPVDGRGWQDLPVRRGHLFFVGDPKQSIYRFRRADIALFLAARDHYGRDGGLVELTTNFRTGDAVLAWANQVFGELIRPSLEVVSQPEYVALDPVRDSPPAGPPVAVMGREPHARGTLAEALRAAEAAEVVATIHRAMTEEWSVDDGRGGWRSVDLGDIAILLPARTSLSFLEDALDDAGIAYRTESSSLVYATRAIRDLLLTARAIDDPTDHLAAVAALRSPLFGCGDDDLYRFKAERRGSFTCTAPSPDGLPDDDPVGAGLAWLGARHRERWHRSPSEVLEQIARDRRMFELGFADGRPRDLWRRLRFVIDQARAWHEATGGSLRQYLRWVEHQRGEGSRVAEAVLPETDDDAVRILTIHAAKGLEFPVVIASGLSTRPGGFRRPAEVVFPHTGPVGYKFGRHVTTDAFDEYTPIDEQMSYDERVRLLYVACTRARDHLVVSLHRSERAREADRPDMTNAELLLAGIGEHLDALPDAPGSATAAPALPFAPARPPVMPIDTWRATVPPAIERASRPRTVAATALAPDGAPEVAADEGLDKRPRDLDLPPWLKGRYGSALGRAVHSVLQSIVLATGAGLDAAVAAQAAAEGLIGDEMVIAAHARSAIGSDVVREAARCPHWREVYVGVPLVAADGEVRVVEGYIDLLYRSDDGLVVVDYKTGAADSDDVVATRLDAYRAQGAAYALAVADATGEHVSRCTFLFLTPGGALARDLPDLAGAVEAVRSRVDTGLERV